MVAEISGSMVVVASATAVSLVVAAAIIDTAGTFDNDVITNISVQAWDRFGSSDYVWVEISMTYPGGPLEISGDIELCLVPPEPGVPCENTTEPPAPECGDSSLNLNNTKHNCWEVKRAGSANQLRYEGRMDVGFDAGRGDPLGYVVSSRLHDSSGTVGVR